MNENSYIEWARKIIEGIKQKQLFRIV